MHKGQYQVNFVEVYKLLNCRWMKMAKIGLPNGSGKRSKVREKSLKSQGIWKRILSGNPVYIRVKCARCGTYTFTVIIPAKWHKVKPV